jgi:hypothetical protein
MEEDRIILMTDENSIAEPPPTDMFFNEKSIIRSRLLDPMKLGAAVGFACGCLFLIISLIVMLTGAGMALDFFKLFYLGFTPNTYVGIPVGIAWSFVYGFIFGILLGVLYNTFMQKSLAD